MSQGVTSCGRTERGSLKWEGGGIREAVEEAASNPRTVSGKAQVARTRTEGDLWSLVAQCGAHCWANMEVSKRQVNPNPKRTHLPLCPLQTQCENANSRIYVGLHEPELTGAETAVGSTPHWGLCLHSTILPPAEDFQGPRQIQGPDCGL